MRPEDQETKRSSAGGILVSTLLDAPVLVASVKTSQRPCVQGKFIFCGNEKLYIRGVTYGPFRPDADGGEYHSPDVVERDFAQMAANGLNAVRTYTVPPRWLLDAAQRHGLRVMVGLPWEQHVAFLDDKARVRSIKERVRAGVCVCAGHPAVLCYTIGNEIPAPMVRWYGHRRVAQFLKRLYQAAKPPQGGGRWSWPRAAWTAAATARTLRRARLTGRCALRLPRAVRAPLS